MTVEVERFLIAAVVVFFFLLFGILAVGSVVFLVVVLVKTLSPKEADSGRWKKIVLLLPTVMLSVVLVYGVLAMPASGNSIVVVAALFLSIPVQIVFVVLVFLGIRILKQKPLGNPRFIVTYIAICAVALPYFRHVIILIGIGIRAGRLVL